jgi:hypothetical protein
LRELGFPAEIDICVDPPSHSPLKLTLSGPLQLVEGFLEAGSIDSWNRYRSDPSARLFPIAIPSHGRPDKSNLNLELPHALGRSDEAPPLVVLVVRQSEVQAYRSFWPQSLIAAIPQSDEQPVGYTRWALQMWATYGYIRSNDGQIRKCAFSFLWVLDDLLSGFYPLKKLTDAEFRIANRYNEGACKVQLRREVVPRAFRKALMSIQSDRTFHLNSVALAGFIRDDGLCCCKTAASVENTVTFYKCVMMNTVALQRLEVPSILIIHIVTNV